MYIRKKDLHFYWLSCRNQCEWQSSWQMSRKHYLSCNQCVSPIFPLWNVILAKRPVIIRKFWCKTIYIYFKKHQQWCRLSCYFTFLLTNKMNKHMHLEENILETVKKLEHRKPVSVVDSTFSIAGQSSSWYPRFWSLKRSFLVLIWNWNIYVVIIKMYNLFFTQQSERYCWPGNCLDTIGCCWRTYLIYPFRGLFGGPLGRELRFFTALVYGAGRTLLHLKHTQILLAVVHYIPIQFIGRKNYLNDWMGRGKSGIVFLGCCPCDLTPDKR